MTGFIANSSGAAYFQFYILKTKKNTTIKQLLNHIGIKQNSIAHIVLKEMGLIDSLMKTRKSKHSTEEIFKKDMPTWYYGETTKNQLEKRHGKFPEIDNEKNDYFIDWKGFTDNDFGETETWFSDWEDEKHISLGFLYLMKLKTKIDSRFIYEAVSYAEY